MQESSRRALLAAFRRVVAPELRARGFQGRSGHFLRSFGDVQQIVELQLSVYGGRVTANLGLELPWLPPILRWLPRPRIGPHAHDATRWIRIGLVGPDPEDHWWDFLSEAAADQLAAAEGVGKAILEHGLPWLEAESDRKAFLKHARERLDRSRSPVRPEGRFAELRLLAAVLAWNGRFEEAKKIAEEAEAMWPEERPRLSAARGDYAARHPEVGDEAIPDLAAELHALISPTTGEFVGASSGPERRAPKRRSRSERQR